MPFLADFILEPFGDQVELAFRKVDPVNRYVATGVKVFSTLEEANDALADAGVEVRFESVGGPHKTALVSIDEVNRMNFQQAPIRE